MNIGNNHNKKFSPLNRKKSVNNRTTKILTERSKGYGIVQQSGIRFPSVL